MIIKLFGVMDLLAAILLIFLKYAIGQNIAYIFIIYLIVKGLLFFGDFNSIMDIICGIFMFLAVQRSFTIITWILVVFLLQKSFFSLVA
tara:strand:+ start:105 stop:371 length:267 start_codon:yes stop_codon:yes gene_type:complete